MKNLLLFLLFHTLPAIAQKGPTGNKRIDSLISTRVGTPFPPLGECKTLDGRSFNFNTFTKPTVIYVGSATCPPCAVESPLMEAYAHTHPETHFVYLTSSDSTLVAHDHPHYWKPGLPQNFFPVQVPDEYLRSHKIFVGYPTKWIVSAGGTVRWMFVGGNARDGSLFIKDMETELEK